MSYVRVPKTADFLHHISSKSVKLFWKGNIERPDMTTSALL